MYPEFVALYVLLSVVIVFQIAIIAFLVFLYKKMSNMSNNTQITSNQYYSQNYQQPQYQQRQGGVVFCQRCATQFDSSQPCCPNCGMRR